MPRHSIRKILRRTADIFDNTLLPAPLSLENYAKVFDGSTMFGQALLNSLIVAGTTTTFALVLGVFAAGELETAKAKLLDDALPGWQTGRTLGRPSRR